MKVLQLLAIGEFDEAMLAQVGASLAAQFHVPWETLRARLDPQFAFHAERQQFHSTEILNRVNRFAGRETWRLLAFTEVDLYIPILTFVFGEAQLGDTAAIISGHRLRQEFYGLPPDSTLYSQRLLKEAVHELGHTLDLRHCDDYSCAMAASHSVEWIDLKEAGLCAGCAARVVVPPQPVRRFGLPYF